MIEILKNPKTENYHLLKETILSRRFPWFYASTTTHGESEGIPGFVNVPMFGHVFIGRPETYGWSTTDSDLHQLAVDVVREILHENNFISKQYYILRLAANCVLPNEGLQFSEPHIDHTFPHFNFIVYLTNSGGNTIVEEDTHEPIEDQPIIFTGWHYMQLPKKERRIVLVATIFPLDEENLNSLGIPYLNPSY